MRTRIPTRPDDLKKCTSCATYKPRREYYTAGKRTKVQSRCIECINRIQREKGHQSKDWRNHAPYRRARSRALTRLAALYPGDFSLLLEDEMKKEFRSER